MRYKNSFGSGCSINKRSCVNGLECIYVMNSLSPHLLYDEFGGTVDDAKNLDHL